MGAYRAAIEIDARFASAVFGLVRVALAADQVDEAREALLTLSGKTRDPATLNSIAWRMVDPGGDRRLRDPTSAVPIARRAVKLSQTENTDRLDTLAVALFAAGDSKEAVDVQRRIIELLTQRRAPPAGVQAATAQLRRFTSGGGR